MGAREKLESATVRSSIVVAALARGDCGVEARELLAASGLAIITTRSVQGKLYQLFQPPYGGD